MIRTPIFIVIERCGCECGRMSGSRNRGTRLKRDVLLLHLTTLLKMTDVWTGICDSSKCLCSET